jgi:arginine decarboxylase
MMSNSVATQRTAPRSQRKGRQAKAATTEAAAAEDMLGVSQRIDQFLLMHSARLDTWREITGLAEKWQAGAAQRADLDAAVEAMEAVEGYHAYIRARNSSPCCASGLPRTTPAGRRVSRGGFRTRC